MESDQRVRAQGLYHLGAWTQILTTVPLSIYGALFALFWSLSFFWDNNKSFFFSIGPYSIIIGTPSKIEDVIQYADFTQKVSPIRLVDDSTLDEEPDLEDLYGLTDGNIQLNNTDLHVLPASEFQVCVVSFYL